MIYKKTMFHVIEFRQHLTEYYSIFPFISNMKIETFYKNKCWHIRNIFQRSIWHCILWRHDDVRSSYSSVPGGNLRVLTMCCFFFILNVHISLETNVSVYCEETKYQFVYLLIHLYVRLNYIFTVFFKCIL
jgi:hypothetical protein